MAPGADRSQLKSDGQQAISPEILTGIVEYAKSNHRKNHVPSAPAALNI
jgi:hypothetical protein